MTCNVVLITNGSRPRLLEQTLRTLYENTPADQYSLTLVAEVDEEVLALPWDRPARFSRLEIDPPCHVIGRLKNLGAYWSEKQFGRGEWLCFLDDDMALFPGWLEKMILIATATSPSQCFVLGGVRHPYHGVNSEHALGRFGWHATDAVAGYCHFMRWSTWDKFGVYDAHAEGTGQSEDWKLCNDIVQAGGKVGYIHPPVMAHCGVTNTEGKPAIGSEQIQRVPGVLYL